MAFLPDDPRGHSRPSSDGMHEDGALTITLIEGIAPNQAAKIGDDCMKLDDVESYQCHDPLDGEVGFIGVRVKPGQEERLCNLISRHNEIQACEWDYIAHLMS